jgi:PAS domain S-box-containing protein
LVPLKVSTIYILTAGTWILASDWVIDTLVQDLHLAQRWQILKGLGFVAVSAILLFVLVRLYLRRILGLNEFLAQSEAHFRLIFHHAPMAYQSLDREGRLLEVNPAWLSMLGYTQEEVLSRSFADFVDTAHKERLQERLSELVTRGTVQGVPLDLRHKNGSLISVSANGRVILDDCGVFQRAHCILHNITERKHAEDALREHEARLQSIFRALPTGVAMVRDGTLLEVTDRFCEMGGYSRDELLGKHARILHSSESDYERVVAEMEPGLKQGRTASCETQWRKSDGNSFDVLLSCSLLDPADPDAGVTVTATDITEHKRVQDELRRLSQAVEQSPVSIVITDLRGDIVYVNPRFSQVTGYSSGEVIGRNSRILKSGEMKSDEYRDLWKTIIGGGEWRGQFHNKTKQGTLFWERASISPMRDARGNITHFLAVKEDITAQRLSQERIREQAELLDQTQDAILVVDLERRLRFANRSAAQFHGRLAEELPGERADLLMFPAEPSRCTDVCAITMEKGAWSGELTQTSGYGQVRCVHSRWTLVRDGEGRPKHFLVINTDITEKKRLEEQFLRAQRMESIGTLAGGVAHDLNNILSPILMATDLLRPLAVEKPDQEVLTMLRTTAERGSKIVRQLLAFGRGEVGPRTEVQLRTVSEAMIKVIQETFPKSITLNHRFPEDLWPVRADATQLDQVLLNLCVNARDAMPNGGCLTISAENLELDEDSVLINPDARPGPYVVLQVSDTGTGIPREIIDKIFDPFFTTRETGSGTGLGLSTVLGIVRGHQGFIRVDSRLGEGSQFKVYLPALAPQQERRSLPPLVPLPKGQGELLLIVDDEEAVRRVAHRMLEQYGYRIMTASDGAEGLMIFSRQRREVRAVITDIIMPVVDGSALIRALRRLSPNLPIIAMSGLPAPDDRNSNGAIDADAFLHKPFSTEEIVRTVHRLVDG